MQWREQPLIQYCQHSSFFCDKRIRVVLRTFNLALKLFLTMAFVNYSSALICNPRNVKESNILYRQKKNHPLSSLSLKSLWQLKSWCYHATISLFFRNSPEASQCITQLSSSFWYSHAIRERSEQEFTLWQSLIYLTHHASYLWHLQD